MFCEYEGKKMITFSVIHINIDQIEMQTLQTEHVKKRRLIEFQSTTFIITKPHHIALKIQPLVQSKFLDLILCALKS